jgi:hypothetical protein
MMYDYFTFSNHFRFPVDPITAITASWQGVVTLLWQPLLCFVPGEGRYWLMDYNMVNGFCKRV